MNGEMPTDGPAISVRDLVKVFPSHMHLFMPARDGGRQVLQGMNLEVRAGEILGLLGPNGAGKTTLLEILATLLLPTSGEVRLGGFDVVQQAAEVRGSVGYCSSAYSSFYPRLSGANNLEFFALLNDLDPRQARDRIKWAVDLLRLEDVRDGTFQHYSEGTKQRFALARALLNDPPILLLDEPTRSLDPLLQQETRRFIRDVLGAKLGKTVVLVTHSLSEAEQVCDRIAIMNGGRIAACGTAAQVTAELGGGNLAGAFERALGAAPECV